MRPQVLLDYFITPTLLHLAKVKPGIDSPAARQFMVAIAAQESHCGDYFKQLGNGPAQGPWQVEPATHTDLYQNYLRYYPDIQAQLETLLPAAHLEHPLISHPLYSCAVARLQIYRQPCAMPELNDRDAMWGIYKRYFNSHQGKATQREWNHNWEKFVTPLDLGGEA